MGFGAIDVVDMLFETVVGIPTTFSLCTLRLQDRRQKSASHLAFVSQEK
jgi:hypothetical protein